jgi:hypothetical protein
MSRAHAKANAAPAMVASPRYNRPARERCRRTVAINLLQNADRRCNAEDAVAPKAECERPKKIYYAITGLVSL